MSESNAQPDLTRVDDLWFPDGNLILRAENTLFRVLSSILGARSSVFHDMVAFPQPSQPDGDTVDGHAVVCLHDSAAEVEVFLRAIFDSSFFNIPPSPVDFTTVIGVMRLAHKYDVQYLFRRALSHLDSMYPTDFSKFIDVNTSASTHHVRFKEGDIIVDTVTLRAVSEVGALWFLPSAYYCIAGYSGLREMAAQTLDSHDQQMCLAARVELDILEDWSDDDDDLNPLGFWVFHYMEGLCSSCYEFGQEEFKEAQKSFWDRLPQLFGLPNWNELIEMRRKVMDGPA
ncbi:BTB domain-containing protein [Mycena venus]|uniref:BTB domain-containing protein n=1 Tax=Mycena venus TaxID=2733690 RepID=A0A8H6Y4R3_9AGAR|nr:BTB domain-containing protein [Mycena venus]